MKNYYIATDDSSLETEAENIADALEEFGAPKNVRDAAAFEDWLEGVGGYGHITEDDIEIARVRS